MPSQQQHGQQRHVVQVIGSLNHTTGTPATEINCDIAAQETAAAATAVAAAAAAL